MAGKKAGRPKTELTKKQIEKIQEFAGLGFTVDAIASYLDIPLRTFERMKQKGDILAVYKKAKADALGKVGQSLFNQATSTTDPNTTAAIFYLKTQGRWSTEYEAAIAEGVLADRQRWLELAKRVLPAELLTKFADAVKKEFG